MPFTLYFEIVLMDLKKKEKMKEPIEHIECCDVVVECEWVDAVSRNICGTAEMPEGQPEK